MAVELPTARFVASPTILLPTPDGELQSSTCEQNGLFLSGLQRMWPSRQEGLPAVHAYGPDMLSMRLC